MKISGSDDARIAERNDPYGNERATEADDGGQQVQRTVNASGNDVFFQEGFGAVDERLQQAEGTDAAGSPAILNSANELAFEKHRVGDGQQEHHRHHHDLQQTPQEKLQNRQVPSPERSVAKSKDPHFAQNFINLFSLLLPLSLLQPDAAPGLVIRGCNVPAFQS